MYKRNDGLYEKKITINGKRIVFRGRSEREVEKKIREYGSVKHKFSDAAKEFWAEIEPTLAQNTLRSYIPAYDRAVDEFGSADLEGISTAWIETYLDRIGKTYAKKTVNNQRQIIRQIMQKAVRNGWITFNAAKPAQIPKGLKQKKRHAPSREDIAKIKDSADKTFGLFFLLIYTTGARRGEALALKYEDIDREKKTVRINKSVYYIGNTPHIKEPKTESGNRIVPLLSLLEKKLPRGRGYIFSDDNGKSPMTDGRVEWMIQVYQRETGVKASPHVVRHGYATALNEAGVDYKKAQKFLGHAQLSTTMDIYTDLRESDDLTQDASVLNETF